MPHSASSSVRIAFWLALICLAALSSTRVQALSMCNIQVGGSNICDASVVDAQGKREVDITAPFTLPADQYMRCNWKTSKGNQVEIYTHQASNVYISLMSPVDYASFVAGQCYWNKDWASGGSGVAGSCAASANYGGKAITAPTAITATWSKVTLTELDSIIYNPGPNPVVINDVKYIIPSSNTTVDIIVGVVCALVVISFAYYMYHKSQKQALADQAAREAERGPGESGEAKRRSQDAITPRV